jgi:hypothetical protein
VNAVEIAAARETECLPEAKLVSKGVRSATREVNAKFEFGIVAYGTTITYSKRPAHDRACPHPYVPNAALEPALTRASRPYTHAIVTIITSHSLS